MPVFDPTALNHYPPRARTLTVKLSPAKWHEIGGPIDFLVVKSDFDGWLDHRKIRRDIEITRRIKVNSRGYDKFPGVHAGFPPA
jgi:hypothetical protein